MSNGIRICQLCSRNAVGTKIYTKEGAIERVIINPGLRINSDDRVLVYLCSKHLANPPENIKVNMFEREAYRSAGGLLFVWVVTHLLCAVCALGALGARGRQLIPFILITFLLAAGDLFYALNSPPYDPVPAEFRIGADKE